MTDTSRGISAQLEANAMSAIEAQQKAFEDRVKSEMVAMCYRIVWGETMTDRRRREFGDALDLVMWFDGTMPRPGDSRIDRGLLYWWGAS